jgi:hypothetical protein
VARLAAIRDEEIRVCEVLFSDCISGMSSGKNYRFDVQQMLILGSDAHHDASPLKIGLGTVEVLF